MGELAQKLAWEKRYSDDSGIEFAVLYDATKYSFSGCLGIVEFHSVDTVVFPVDRIDWLIGCLMRIKAELPPSPDSLRGDE